MNQSSKSKVLFLTRHGESEFNIWRRIGGNPDLSLTGKKYPQKLSEFLKKNNQGDLNIYTSTLSRTIQTVDRLDYPKHILPVLNEINAGICDSMTYDEIKERYPDVYYDRKADKFNYRYPQGESYRDIYERLESSIIEWEKGGNALIVSHYAVIRCILAYYFSIPAEKVPYIYVPLHHVFQITRLNNDYELQVFKINVDDDETLYTYSNDTLEYV